MHTILKILLSLKLTFILIIFGVGGTYILERSSLMRNLAGPPSMRLIQAAEHAQTEPVKEITPLEKHELNDEVQSSLKPCSLSDLGLHIVL
jgi:hypothetical protein